VSNKNKRFGRRLTGWLLSAALLLPQAGFSATNESQVQITTKTLTNGNLGESYVFQLQGNFTSDDPISWSVSQGALPPGLSMSGSGRITGTPQRVGYYGFTARASDGTERDTQTLKLRIVSPLEYPSGTLLKKVGDPTVYLLENQALKGFRTPTEFDSHGLNWDWLVEITATEFDIYRTLGVLAIRSGTLVKPADSPTVYLKQGNKLLPFSSADTFLSLGYQWDAIRTMVGGEDGYYEKGAVMSGGSTHFESTKIKTAGNPTVYILEQDGEELVRRGIPSAGVFLSQGWRWPEIVTIPSGEMAGYPSGELLFYRDGALIKGDGTPAVYVMEYGKRRPIPTGDDFEAMRYRWENIISIPAAELSQIATGSQVKADSVKLAELAARREAARLAAEQAERDAFRSEYLEGSVGTARGTFSYKMIKATQAGTRVRTLSGHKSDCGDGCTARPLADYVADVGGFAGIHGTYFCPPDYGYCAGQTYRYDSPVFDSAIQRWLQWDKRSWNFRGALTFSGSSAGSYWPGSGVPESGIEAGIMNYPMLTHRGGVVATWDNSDDKQRLKGTRAGIGVGGGYIYLVQVSGASVEDLAHVMQALGAGDALNLDGGGSTALYYQGGYKVGPGRLLPNAIVLTRY
jgi:hypothetical protein